MFLEEIKIRLLHAIDNKKTNRTKVAREANLGYITILNVLDDNYEFEVKHTTLEAIDKYLKAIGE